MPHNKYVLSKDLKYGSGRDFEKKTLQKSVTYISHTADCDNSFLLGKSVLVVKNKPSAWIG